VPGKGTTLLDFMAQSGVRTICFHEHWTDIQNYPATTRSTAPIASPSTSRAPA
jgi:hypothetical protein